MAGIISKLRNLFKGNGNNTGSGNIDNRYLSAMVTPWASSYGEMKPTDFDRQVNAYRGWIYACVNKIAVTVAETPLRLYARIKKGKETQVEEIKEHPFLELTKKVNPFMNEFDLREMTTIYLLLTGNCYWYIVNNGLGTPAEIWVIPSQRVTIVPDRERFIRGYIYQRGADKVAFSEEEIIHFKLPNPGNQFYGLSPLMAAAYAYDINHYMKKYEIALFENMARPDIALVTDQNLSKDDIKRLRKEWSTLYKGASKAGKVAVLSKGLDLKEISFSPREMSYLAGHKMTRDEIAAIFGVPKAMLTTEDVNRANHEASEYSFKKNTILPMLRRLEQKINEKLLPRYDERLFCKFDNPVPEDKEFELRKQAEFVKQNILLRDEVREELGLSPLPGDVGSQIWMPMNMLPAGGKMLDDISQKIAERITRVIKTPAKKKSIFTQDEKKKRWYGFIAKVSTQERKFRDELVKLFEEQEKVVLANLKKTPKGIIDKSIIDHWLFPIDEWKTRFEAWEEPFIASIILERGEEELSQLITGVSFDMQNPRVQNFLKNKIHKFSFEVNDTTIQSLKKELLEGLDLGEGIPDLRKRVKKVFNFAKTFRAERIARTEVIGSSNFGNYEAMVQSNVVEEREWLATMDDRVRDSHAAMNGEHTSLGKPYSNGLMYPGDPNGDPSEVVNCRCTEVVHKFKE